MASMVHGRLAWVIMQVLVSADMEGATGVTWTDDCVPGTEPTRAFKIVTAIAAGAVQGVYG
jgi:D-amino peptidase